MGGKMSQITFLGLISQITFVEKMSQNYVFRGKCLKLRF